MLTSTIAAQFRRASLASACALFAVAGLCHAAGVSEGKLIETLASGGESAAQAAGWLGGLESVKGLKAIIAQKNSELVHAYMRGFPDKYTIPYDKFPYVDDQLNPELEKIVLEHMEDGETGRALMNLLYARKYRTKALFEALLKHLIDAPERSLKWEALHTITHSDLAGIEQPILDLFPRLNSQAQDSLLNYWRDRAFPPASLPLFKALVTRTVPRQVNTHYYKAIARIGTAEAAAFLAEEIEQYRDREPDESLRRSLMGLLNCLTSIPQDVPLPMARIIERTPYKHEQYVSEGYINLLEARPSANGIDDLLSFLPDGKLSHQALFALKLIDSPKGWKRIGDGVKQLLDTGGIPDMGYYRDNVRVFVQQLENPEQYRQRVATLKRRLEYDRREDVLENTVGNKLEALKERDPEKYKQAEPKYDEMLKALLHDMGGYDAVFGGAVGAAAPKPIPASSQPQSQ